MKIKVLSYNIHKGFDWKNQNYTLDRIKEIITDSGADLVFLQEVVGENQKFKDKGLIDEQFEFLADTIWSHYSYAQNAIYDHGHHGNLILSKYPIENWENTSLTTNRFEKRGLLMAEIKPPQLEGRSIFAMCLHLNLLHSDRVKQYQIVMEKVQEIVVENNSPIILAGDFNDWNKKSPRYFELELEMTDAYKSINGSFAKTFPAQFPFLALDRVYIKNLKVIQAKTISMPMNISPSDHIPIYCELEFYE
ncbi:MAG: EEP domain-containing protein [Bacteriovoracaceae bacterium]|jgi:endonuclease/exonuclease/phosphatase family metal-dependent hydrolase|nr:EEP domain-containing protein [Bacteriovoracaceae bacterium]